MQVIEQRLRVRPREAPRVELRLPFADEGEAAETLAKKNAIDNAKSVLVEIANTVEKEGETE